MKVRRPTPTKVPGIPPVPKDVSPSIGQFLTSLVEAVEIRLGRRGDPRDRAVTLRELLTSGVATEVAQYSFDPNNYSEATTGFNAPSSFPENDQPYAPTSFTATGGYELANLFWDYARYRGHSHTEIWRHDSDVIGDAQLIGISSGTAYIDPIGESTTRYYWVRHVSTAGVTSPFSSSAGTAATTASNVSQLLTSLSGAITTSELVTSLQNDVGAIPGLQSQYVVRVNANNRVSGFGLASGAGGTSSFAILADSFSVVNPDSNSDTIVPFTVQTTSTTIGGETVPAGVYMDTAFIRNGTIDSVKIADAAIDNAKISDLDAGKINAGTISTSRLNIDGSTLTSTNGVLQVGSLNAGLITAGTIDASVINVANLDADNIVSGQILADRIDVTDLLLPTGGGSVSGATIGAFSTNNTSEQKLVTSIGTGLGYYQGFVRVIGGTNHLKQVRFYFTSSNTTTSGTTVYLTPYTENLSGQVDRFYNSADTANIPIAFVNSASDGPIYLWVEAQPDSAPDTFGGIEARFLRFGTGSSVFTYGNWSTYEYSRTSTPYTYWRVNVQNSSDLLFWDGNTKTPVSGSGGIGTSSTLLVADGYQYQRGSLEFIESDVTNDPEPVLYVKAYYYKVRRRTYQST